MVDRVDINQTVVTNNRSIPQHTIPQETVESVQDSEETIYINERFSKDYGYFTHIPKLRSAIIMKAIWTVGKGYTADKDTMRTLEQITGDGKQTFRDILFNMVVGKQFGRESYAEIIRSEETGDIINLKLLNPATMRVIYGKDGMIKRFEQSLPSPQKGILGKIKSVFKKESFVTFKPHEIFYMSQNKFAGSIHGTSVPEALEEVILADDENFKIMRRMTRFQAVPFIIFKVKADDPATISNFKANIKAARNTGDDLIIPDDSNLLSYEVVQVNPSSILMDWRNNVNNEFYRAVGMPLILFGSAGSTESGGKIEYLGHETVFEHDQRQVEEDIYAQLGLKINLISPTSLLENLQTDESKDQQNAINFQESDVEAGRGR